MARLLIKNGYVVTVDGGRAVHPEGFVLIEDARIAAVGPMTELPAETEGAEVIDAAGCLVMPGLINLHQHHWYTLFKGLADGYLLEDWITDFVFPLVRNLDDGAMRVASYLDGMEMLATGTTCSLNHSVTATTPSMVRAIIEPQAELGIRQVFAKELRCRTPGNPNHPLSLDESLAAMAEEVERWQGAADGLVRMAMVIEANAHWIAAGMSTDELVRRGYEFARDRDLRISSHIAGGTLSLDKGFLKHLRATGRTDVQYLMELGVLDKHWLMIHGIHVTDTDIAQMAHVGCHFVYTPSSEAMRGGGIAPFAKAQAAGVNTALGTDGPMVDYSVDMVEQMKICTLMQHVRHLDPTRMPVERTIEMATINGARALGLDHEIGSLEAGKRADIAIFDMHKPHIGVLNRPLSAFVSAGKGTDTKAVIVNGAVVYRDGAFANGPSFDEVLGEATQRARQIAEAAGHGRRFSPEWRPV
jgi:5-methylthioadenosine/S-adenosylhomocysteine deaminase